MMIKNAHIVEVDGIGRAVLGTSLFEAEDKTIVTEVRGGDVVSEYRVPGLLRDVCCRLVNELYDRLPKGNNLRLTTNYGV
jgi:hypothetical protein